VQNQIDNWSNSKLEPAVRLSGRLVLGIGLGFAALMLWAASALPPPLSGRLHAAAVPLALGGLALAAALVTFWLSRKGRDTTDHCLPSTTASWRSMLAAVLALAILALGVRGAGLLPAAFAAGTVAALGVVGVGLARALLIGAGLSLLAALVFIAGLRQPLPLFPALLPGL
jgi:hypothetical protein